MIVGQRETCHGKPIETSAKGSVLDITKGGESIFAPAALMETVTVELPLLLRATQSAQTAGLADTETGTVSLDEVAELRQREQF